MTTDNQQKMQQVHQVQRKAGQRDLRDVIATVITEGIKTAAMGGANLGLALQKGAIKQGFQATTKAMTKQGIKQVAQKTQRAAAEVAINTAQRLDQEDDNNGEVFEMGMALYRGRIR